MVDLGRPFVLLEGEFCRLASDPNTGVFQVREILHSLDLPKVVLESATDEQKRETWYRARYWEEQSGTNGCDLAQQHGTYAQEINWYVFEQMPGPGGRDIEEVDRERCLYDRMGEVMLHNFESAERFFPASAVHGDPVLVIHYAEVKRRTILCNGMKNAYVTSAQISEPEGQPWFLPENELVLIGSVFNPAPSEAVLSRTALALNLPFRIAAVCRKIMAGTEGKFSKCERIDNVSVVEWRMFLKSLGPKVVKSVKRSDCGSTQQVFSSEFIHWSLFREEVAERVDLKTKADLVKLTNVAGMFWNSALPTAVVDTNKGCEIHPTLGTRIKCVTPRNTRNTQPEMPDGEKYRSREIPPQKKQKLESESEAGSGAGAGACDLDDEIDESPQFGGFRDPGVGSSRVNTSSHLVCLCCYPTRFTYATREGYHSSSVIWWLAVPGTTRFTRGQLMALRRPFWWNTTMSIECSPGGLALARVLG